MMKRVISYGWLAVVALFMYIPVLILAVYSFTDSATIGAIRGFHWRITGPYSTMTELREMILGTIALAVVAAILATVLGALGAVGAFYAKPFSKT